MRFFILSIAFFALFICCYAEVYFSEEFDDGWEQRWVIAKGENLGDFEISAGQEHVADENDKGLRTTQDYRFYRISAETKEFSNRGKTLILQYSVKNEQALNCGGSYIKLLPAGLDQANFDGNSAYNIMFGPDICENQRTHLIFTHKGKNHLRSEDLPTENNQISHVYSLFVYPNNTYSVSIDAEEIARGSVSEDFGILPPAEILDPSVTKPEDWDENPTIPDPSVTKPDDWDEKNPESIQDSSVTKPDDWDDELDGEWEPPVIPNPQYTGPWAHPRVTNPNYKGKWVHPTIKNPEYVADDTIYAYDSNRFVGFELWQVQSGSIFDHILVTDDAELARKWAQKTLDQQTIEREKQIALGGDEEFDDDEAEAQDFIDTFGGGQFNSEGSGELDDELDDELHDEL